MKRIIAILFSLILLTTLCACRQNATRGDRIRLDTATVELGETYTDVEGVNIRIKNIIWDSNDIKFEIEWINDTIDEVTYGDSYTVELERDGEWISRKKIDTLTFASIGYSLKWYRTEEKMYNLTDTFDIAENGKYRFVTDCRIEDGKNTKCNLSAEFTVKHKGRVNGSDEKTYLNFNAKYIRTSSKTHTESYPVLTVVRSVDDLTSYYKSNKDRFDLERRGDTASDGTMGFLDVCDKYDSEFFKDNALVLIAIEEGSGSTRHIVDNVTASASGEFSVDIRSLSPEVGTCDMAQWHIMLEIDKEYAPNSTDCINIFMNGRSITDEDDQTENDQVSSSHISEVQPTLYYYPENKRISLDLSDVDASAMADILVNLDYDPMEVCLCAAEYTVELKTGVQYGINISERYARCDKGQTKLTDAQVDRLNQIIQRVTGNAE